MAVVKEVKIMKIRAWSKKVVSVLRYFQLHPHTTLFGVTGDIDNLGIYVARNGRAQAEILVDTYNRIIGSVYYDYIQSHPHEFFETCFIPSGEEVFILGTSSDVSAAEAMFHHLKHQNIVSLLIENTSLDCGGTDITFGCSKFDRESVISSVDHFLVAVEGNNHLEANISYLKTLSGLRAKLSVRLDIEKFSSLGVGEKEALLFRNLVYLKTIQYKRETKKLLIDVGALLGIHSDQVQLLMDLIGQQYGLKDVDPDHIVKVLLDMFADVS